MSEKSSDTGAFLAGFVIGGLVGSAVALILAPRSGEEMRHQLMERGQAMRPTGAMPWTAQRDNAVDAPASYFDAAVNDAAAAAAEAEEQARIVLSPGNQPPLAADDALDSAETDASA